MRRLLLCVCVALAVPMIGCGITANDTEKVIQNVMERHIGPAIGEAMQETAARATQMSGQVSGINPGYDITFEGLWVTGVKGGASARLVGVSANISGAMQTDQGPDLTKAPATTPDEPVDVPVEPPLDDAAAGPNEVTVYEETTIVPAPE